MRGNRAREPGEVIKGQNAAKKSQARDDVII
jgi:hypothetical protein